MRVSIVIPLHGGPEEIRACLASLDRCRESLHEVIVVDDASPDEAPQVVESFGWVKLLRLPSNRGFAAACNAGYRASSGEIVIFLNSDTVVPCVAIDRMRETFGEDDIAAVGPYSNSTINVQKIDVPYRTLDEMPAFAEAYAKRPMEDVEIDFLIGFCLAVRRDVLDRIGEPFDERFGIGTYEDNDLSYRFRREGYRLIVAHGAFVHHSGSATFQRENIAMRNLLATNEEAFLAKWRDDISSGFASHLSGFGAERIVFNPGRKPEVVLARLAEVAKRADISLCMIVRDEEAVLAEALRHAPVYFTQIVVVDTGSTDRTAEIARQAGAEVYAIEWEEDFAAARNESLRHARGRWIFWMDADDSLSLASAEALLNDAAEAAEDVVAFVVPSQSVGKGGALTTRVDHVKLFRNRADIRFEGRIHEQVLPSIEATGLRVVRSDAVVVHTGYDIDQEGHERKLARDWRILTMELQERPNHPFVLFNAAMIARFSNRHEEALAFAERAIAESDARGDRPIRKADVVRVEALRALDREDDALAAALEGIRRVGDDPELHFYAGTLLTTKGRFREALAHFEAVRGPVEEDFTSVDVSMLTYKLWHNAGTVCLRLGRYADAKAWLLRAIESAPEPGPSLQLLFMAALQARDVETATKLLDFLERHTGLTETWSLFFMRLEDMLRGPGTGERALRKIARAHPDSPGPRLAICQHMMQTGRAPEALRDLALMAENGVPDAAFYIAMYEERSGDLASAREWMRRALELNPGHPMTEKELERLEALS